MFTYEVWRYQSDIGWEPYCIDYETGEPRQLTEKEMEKEVQEMDRCSDYAFRVYRSDGETVHSIGDEYSVEHSAWLSRCPH